MHFLDPDTTSEYETTSDDDIFEYDIQYDTNPQPSSYPESQFSEPEPIYQMIDDYRNHLLQQQPNDATSSTLSPEETSSSPPPLISSDDAIVFSNSISQSRELISRCFGISPSTLRTLHLPGLIVLRLEDFSLIRSDPRCNREFPHFMILGLNSNIQSYPDFYRCLAHFYPPNSS